MEYAAELQRDHQRFNTAVLSRYLISGLILYLASVALVYFQWRPMLAAVALGAPVGLFLLTQPRLAAYQFVFCVFIHFAVIHGIPVLLADVSALLLIIAASLDWLLNNPRQVGDDRSRPGPRLLLNFGLLLGALILAALFSHDMTAAYRPIVRLVFLCLTFLALYHLAGRAGVGRLLKFYFWLCVGHSILVIIPFITSRGVFRSFGLSGKMFDELAMFAVPLGLAFYLWSRRGRGWPYLIGSLIALAGLLATQSRAPILFAAAAVAAVVWMSRSRARSLMQEARPGTPGEVVNRRVRLLLWSSVVLVPLVILVTPDVLATVLGRFNRLLTLKPGGTFALRMVLWKTALMTFADNPLLGIGPGLFRSLSDFYPTLHLTPVYYYVRSLSAHNLLLHYLAETGLIGASALVALFVNQFRIGRAGWKRIGGGRPTGTALALYAASLLLLISALIESGWMWGQLGFIMVFFLSLLARRDNDTSAPVASEQ